MTGRNKWKGGDKVEKSLGTLQLLPDHNVKRSTCGQ